MYNSIYNVNQKHYDRNIEHSNQIDENTNGRINSCQIKKGGRMPPG